MERKKGQRFRRTYTCMLLSTKYDMHHDLERQLSIAAQHILGITPTRHTDPGRNEGRSTVGGSDGGEATEDGRSRSPNSLCVQGETRLRPSPVLSPQVAQGTRAKRGGPLRRNRHVVLLCRRDIIKIKYARA